MERCLILVTNEKTGKILASRTVAAPLADNLIENLDVYVGHTGTLETLNEGLVQFGFQLTSKTIAFRITGL